MEREFHGHGSSSDPTYSKYQAMKQRCLNPKHKSYADYGGRGIKVCDRWLESFANFLADMGVAPDGMTIERDKSDGNYEPSNCRWATKQEQGKNTRSNVKVEIDGKSYPTLRDAAIAHGLPYGTVRMRTAGYGWSIERALKTPIDTKKRKKA
ncbi:hypothetical protein [Massilia sp. TN1-12]|uniref:hypothetical protein n=1 Tax=Massilia paldalensis TaxID=3377675 RepID=UPI00384EB0F2